jgi:hypothetical protein
MRARFENGQVGIYDAYLYREVIKEIPGRIWEPESKAWFVPVSLDSITTLKTIGCEFDSELEKASANLIEVEPAKDKPPLVPAEPIPIKVKPYQHQIQAYNFVCDLLGLFQTTGDAA